MDDRHSTARIAGRNAQRRMTLVLLPLRLWLGLAWLRSGVAKVMEPAWFDGTALQGFVQGQLEAGAPPLVPYAALMESAWIRLAAPLGIAVLVVELAIGVALLTGTFTNLALLAAIVLNVNFILAGAPAPSHLYVVIELVLLLGGAGAYYGADRYLSLYVRSPLLTSRTNLHTAERPPRALLLTVAALCLVIAAAAAPSVGSLLPAQGADDPAFVVATLCTLVAVVAVVLARQNAGTTDAASGSRDDAASGGRITGVGDGRVADRARDADAWTGTPRRAAAGAATAAAMAGERTGGGAMWRDAPMWPQTSAPAPMATAGRARAADTPTEMFARPRGPRPAPDPTDVYAELRALVPADAWTDQG